MVVVTKRFEYTHRDAFLGGIHVHLRRDGGDAAVQTVPQVV